jgi:hypothetical protein
MHSLANLENCYSVRVRYRVFYDASEEAIADSLRLMAFGRYFPTNRFEVEISADGKTFEWLSGRWQRIGGRLRPSPHEYYSIWDVMGRWFGKLWWSQWREIRKRRQQILNCFRPLESHEDIWNLRREDVLPGRCDGIDDDCDFFRLLLRSPKFTISATQIRCLDRQILVECTHTRSVSVEFPWPLRWLSTRLNGTEIALAKLDLFICTPTLLKELLKFEANLGQLLNCRPQSFLPRIQDVWYSTGYWLDGEELCHYVDSLTRPSEVDVDVPSDYAKLTAR